MDGFLCMKALVLSGQGYMPGEFIPADKVLPSRVRTLTREKYIAPATGPTDEKTASSRSKKRSESSKGEPPPEDASGGEAPPATPDGEAE